MCFTAKLESSRKRLKLLQSNNFYSFVLRKDGILNESKMPSYIILPINSKAQGFPEKVKGFGEEYRAFEQSPHRNLS